MIIQCGKCQTKFRLDDSRVTDKGVKVRCTKCKYVFTVQKEEPEAGSFEPGVPFVAPSPTVATVDSLPFEDTSFRSEQVESLLKTSTFDAPAMLSESDEFHVADTAVEPATAAEPAAIGDEIDFSNFDFGDSAAEPDSAKLADAPVDDLIDTTILPAAPVSLKEAPQGLDFSDDDMFGAVVQSTPEVSNETISFDLEDDSFAESMDMNIQDSSGKSGTLFSLDAPADAPFNLGEIDFGDELTSVAVQQVNPDDLKPSQEMLFAPLAEAQEKSTDEELTRSFLGEVSAGEQEELPPLSIASRRKRSPLFGALISFIALLVISVLGYLGYSSFSSSRETAAPEIGKIGVRAAKASFVVNREAGELLIVSGEALNEYPKPRAALQVKVTVFDAAGQSVVTKTAYGGNPLSEEQLTNLSLDKIEAAMANQFGDSLANMEVAPGKAVPFVVVLANLPKGARDFGVQSAGSTVAAGKQQ